jgi:hypothetical protein
MRQIAYRCGFANEQYFCRFFKAAPSNFRYWQGSKGENLDSKLPRKSPH